MFLPLAVWGVIVTAGASSVYVVLVEPGLKRLDGVPLHAAFSPQLAPSVVLPAVVAMVFIANVRRLLGLEWRQLLIWVWASGVAWAVALSSVRGWSRISAPFRNQNDYLAVIDRVPSVPAFLSGFVNHLREYPVHVQGHPPGFVLLGKLMQSIGLGGASPVAVLCIAVGAAAAPLVLMVVRDVVDESWARRGAPFLVLAPAALWIATSADAFFSGVGATAVALVVLSTARRDRRGVVMAMLGGVAFGIVANLSYGLVLLAVIPLTIAVHRRALRAVLIASGGAVIVLAAFAAFGFWWFDGLTATRDRYIVGIASRRPYELFVFVNLAILSLALGPAVAVALARLRDRRVWLIVGAALAAIAIADVSGMSKSEVERIWLPFMPFLLVACAALVPADAVRNRPRQHSAATASVDAPTLMTGAVWLAVQAGAAILIESLVRTAW